MARSAKLCVATLAAVAFVSAAGLPARALVITSERAVSTAKEGDQVGNGLNQDTADTAAGRNIASIFLGDGTNAFGQPALASGFGAFPTSQGVYWIFLNADNTRNLGDGGLGFARVELTYKAIKEHGDTAFVLNIVPGKLQLADPEALSIPLRASVTLEAGVFSGGGDRLTGASAHATLTGHGGTFQDQTFSLDSEQLGASITLQDDGGNNVVGAIADFPSRQLPLDLSSIVDGTPIEIDVNMFGDVFAPGGETIATAFFRDPAHANDPDPLAGASTVTFVSGSPGPGNAIPEPVTLALLAPALAAAWVTRRGSRGWWISRIPGANASGRTTDDRRRRHLSSGGRDTAVR